MEVLLGCLGEHRQGEGSFGLAWSVWSFDAGRLNAPCVCGIVAMPRLGAVLRAQGGESWNETMRQWLVLG